MMEFGKSLKAAREAKGLTVAQMVEMTHLAPTTITELESEDFSRIAAPIYGRGFVKLYCEAVGLDPKPFVAEFMEIFSGNHETGIKERPVSPTVPESSPAPVEPPVPVSDEQAQASVETVPESPLPPDEPTPVADAIPPIIKQPLSNASRQRDLFFDEPEPPPAPAPVPAPEPTAVETPFPGERADSLADNDHSFSRYAEPLRQLKPLVRSPLWRLAVLAGAALVLLILIVIGIRAIYRATSATPQNPASAPQTSAPAAPAVRPAAKGTKPSAPAKNAPAQKPSARTPQKIPSLYID